MVKSLQDSTILFVIHEQKIGGAGKMIRYVANLMSNHAGKVTLLSIINSDRPEDLDERVLSVNLGIKIQGVIRWRLSFFHQLRSYVKKTKPDIVCAFVSDVCVYSRFATLGLSPIFVSAERGDPFAQPKIWAKLTSWAYNRSDYCVFQLEGARDFYSESIRNKSFIIPNVYLPSKEVIPYDGPRKKTIVTACRFGPEKRLDVLIDAFAIVVSKHPEYSLVLYGDGECKSQYIEQIKRIGLKDKVSFPGFIKNVSLAVREDGIFVLSSEEEGVPNTIIEAMSVGTPIISTDCQPGGPAFLLENGKSGLLVPVNNAQLLAEALLRLIEDKALYERLHNAAPISIKRFHKDIINSMWTEMFSKILV